MSEENNPENSKESSDDEIEIDFGDVAGRIKGLFGGKKKEKKEDNKENPKSEEVKVEKEIEKEEEKISVLSGQKEAVLDKEIAEEEKIVQLGKKEEKIEHEIEEEKENLESLKKEKKEIIRKEKKEKKPEKKKKAVESEEESDDEINIDFSKIKEKILGIFKKDKKEGKGKEKKAESKKAGGDEDEEISLDIRKTAQDIAHFSRKHAVLLLILIPVILSIWFRSYPISLPITDDWAENAVYNSIRSSISGEISRQYPNLPDRQKSELVEKQFIEMKKQNQAYLDQQIEATSQYFKTQMQDESGHTYMPDIDSYFWYHSANNFLKNGSFGDGYVDGVAWNFKRNGRFGKQVEPTIMDPLVMVIMYKFMHFFSSSTTLLSSSFLIPLFLITLSVIPAFFIGRKIAGNIGGLFAGIVLAVNHALLGRSAAGFTDTDAYNIFFPMFILWILIESFEAKDWKKKIALSALNGLLIGLYSRTWGGWWYVFYFGIAALLVNLVFVLGVQVYRKKKFEAKMLDNYDAKNTLAVFAVWFFSSVIFITLLRGFGFLVNSFFGPFHVIKLKEVAVTTIWPNVMTTVAEFNEIATSEIVNQMGGRLFFAIALAGIALMIYKKVRSQEKSMDIFMPALLVIWFIGTTYGFTKGIRFSILMVPAFAVAFGTGLGIAYNYIIRWSSKELNIKKSIGKPILILLFCLLFITPLRVANSVATQEIPHMNDAWYDSLIAIKNDNTSDGVITSWWDFGHWFIAIAEKRVTFDGADQGRRIHWVGKSLLTDDEDVNIGILRMLNCGQELPFDVLDSYINDGPKSIDLLNEIILKDRKTAKMILTYSGLDDMQAERVLNLTHCEDLLPQYYITSEDMIGKSGVWGHFGSWNFTRAAIYNDVHKKEYESAVSIMKEKYGLSEAAADTYYYEISQTNADQWVTGWPGYRSSLMGCTGKNNSLKCGDAVEVNLDSREAAISIQGAGKAVPYSLVYADQYNVKEKVFSNSTVQVSVVLIPYGTGYSVILADPAHADSMFTKLFFFRGHGLEHYELMSYKKSFSGNEIYVWKVDFEPHEPIVIDEFKENTTVSQEAAEQAVSE